MNDLIERLEEDLQESVTHRGVQVCAVAQHHLRQAITALREQEKLIAAMNSASEARKVANAQTLLNAAASGNRNYLAEIEALQSRIEELEAELAEIKSYAEDGSWQ